VTRGSPAEGGHGGEAGCPAGSKTHQVFDAPLPAGSPPQFVLPVVKPVKIRKGHPCPLPVYPSVGEPFCRVSDEGGFWASMAARPRAARQPYARQKPTEFGVVRTGVNHGKTVVRFRHFRLRGYPHRGEGCGEPLNVGIFVEKDSSFIQKTPPYLSKSITRKSVNPLMTSKSVAFRFRFRLTPTSFPTATRRRVLSFSRP